MRGFSLISLGLCDYLILRWIKLTNKLNPDIHSSLIPCCIFRKLAQCQIPQSPGTCYLWKVVTLWRELDLKSRFLIYSGAHANNMKVI